MPSVNPRIAVYLPKSTAAAVQRLAGLRGVSRSAVIRDFLVEAEPVLQRVANLLDLAARSDRNALKEWATTLEAGQSSLEASAATAMATMGDMEADLAKPKRRHGRSKRTQAAARPRRTPGQ